MAPSPRKPRSKLYDGFIYGRLVDPMLSAMHSLIATQVDEGLSALDAGCGTGGLTARLARRCSRVVGVDLSPRNIAFAERRCRRLGLDNVLFEVGDAAHLEAYTDNAFDVAVLSMTLHEMPPASRAPVLAEAGRVAREVLLIDFAVPMPWNLAGLRNRFIEATAGVEHLSAFRDFSKRGGLAPLIDEVGFRVIGEKPIDSRTTVMVRVRRQ